MMVGCCVILYRRVGQLPLKRSVVRSRCLTCAAPHLSLNLASAAGAEQRKAVVGNGGVNLALLIICLMESSLCTLVTYRNHVGSGSRPLLTPGYR